jgi:hypothetical protein
MTEDGSFGVIISAAGAGYDSRFFSFQLIVGGQTIGDSEPSVIWSAVDRLSHLPVLDDPRLNEPTRDPQVALEAVLTDEQCNRALFDGAESLDGWIVAAYVHTSTIVWLTQQIGSDSKRVGPIKAAVIKDADYNSIANRVRAYHAQLSQPSA